MSQVLNLKKHELDQLAQFMGHDIQIHWEFYRLPSDVILTAKVVKVLMSMENVFLYRVTGITHVSRAFGLCSIMVPCIM